jgi:hypothetical protein
MSNAWTPFVWIVERTRRIGVGIKAASHRKVLGEELLALTEALDRSQLQPLLPFIGHLFARHVANLTELVASGERQVAGDHRLLIWVSEGHSVGRMSL